MKMYYVTGNKLKIKLAKKIFKDMDVEIIQKNIETPEIQSLDCEEVSKYSAKWACEKLGIPVIKNDSGFCIEYMNNFPGALAKYVESTIKAEGFIKLLENVDNRRCYWIEVLSYCEPGKEPVSFTSISYGNISKDIREGRGDNFDKIYIPDGETRAFSQMSEDEHISYFSDEAYIKIYNYLKNKDNN